MTNSRKLWAWLALTFFFSFGILGPIGQHIYVTAPPVPESVVADGQTLMTCSDIQTGREAWQTLGGMEIGSVCGHE
jgi:nitric oxide reductase subunit B